MASDGTTGASSTLRSMETYFKEATREGYDTVIPNEGLHNIYEYTPVNISLSRVLDTLSLTIPEIGKINAGIRVNVNPLKRKSYNVFIRHLDGDTTRIISRFYPVNEGRSTRGDDVKSIRRGAFSPVIDNFLERVKIIGIAYTKGPIELISGHRQPPFLNGDYVYNKNRNIFLVDNLGNYHRVNKKRIPPTSPYTVSLNLEYMYPSLIKTLDTGVPPRLTGLVDEDPPAEPLLDIRDPREGGEIGLEEDPASRKTRKRIYKKKRKSTRKRNR